MICEGRALGIEPHPEPQNPSEISQVSSGKGCKSPSNRSVSAVFDSELQAVVGAWSDLLDDVRRMIAGLCD